MIHPEELQQALQKSGQSFSAQELKQIIESVDYEGNGKINYTEFLSATISIKSVLTYEKLWALFKHFDTDDSGTITPANLKDAFANAGK